MPALQDHVVKAQHNEEFAEQLTQHSPRFIDWSVIGTFYAALHYVDAYLATRDLHPPTHHHRSSYVARMRDLRQIYPDYRTLEDTSRDARYTNNPVSDEILTSASQNFIKIKTHILPFLSA